MARRSIGIAVAGHIATGLVENCKVSGQMQAFGQHERQRDELHSMPAEDVIKEICKQVTTAAAGGPVDAIGAGFPGIVQQGVIEESPNLPQMKGAKVLEMLTSRLHESGIDAPAFLYNDADSVAAGLAAERAQLDRNLRVWTLGYGIGYGAYPHVPGVYEGGHMVVTLDPSENYCGCGGKGHLEGIMGHRAMRLRFLDMEPDEVFAEAEKGDQRCCDFVKLWHRALAAAISTSIHIAGPGKTLITGFNAKYVDLQKLRQYLHEVVKMSALQDYTVEVVPESDELAVVGAAVNAEKQAFPEHA